MLSGPVRKLSPHYYWNVNAEHANAAPAAKLSSGPGHLRSIYAVQFRGIKKGLPARQLGSDDHVDLACLGERQDLLALNPVVLGA